MPLTIGSLLGPYEILAPAGAGGMGEVYKARDTRLDRTVAIKVLPSHLSSDPDLKLRFEREAKSISALQHAHICALFDVGSQEGVDFLVMEFLEGETLSERIQQKGALAIEQVLKIGIEVADALEKAHRQGILHRDLKPGNIMLTKAGAKLMDFGLAKASALAVGAGSATAFTAAVTRTSPASPVTQAGTIVGTFQYMSPEQLEGKEADARSDIFAYGAVLYEMATGKRAFEGKSQISVMSAILEKEPEPISAIRPMTPPAFEHVVTRALAKDPDERWQTAADLKSELKWISQTSSSARALSPGIKRKRYQKWMVMAGVAAAAVAITVLAMWMFGVGRSPSTVQAYILPPEDGQFVFTGEDAGPAAISPDGTKVAFQASGGDGKRLLWVRAIHSLTPLSLAGTEGGSYPFWSPDGRQIGFFQDGRMKRIEASGGPVLTICDAQRGRGGSWNKDDVIVFTPGTNHGIFKVPSSGGTPVEVSKLEGAETTSRWPWFLPDGKHFLFLSWDTGGGENTIYIGSLDGAPRKQVVRGVGNAAYANGHLLFVRGGILLAQKFDEKSLVTAGDPRPLFERVQADPQYGRTNFSVAENGALVFTLGPAAEAQLKWLGLDGQENRQLGIPGNYSAPRLSPDGKTLAVATDTATGNQDVWLVGLARETRTRLTFDPAPESNPTWSPDGKRIVFNRRMSAGSQIISKFVDGSGAEEVLLENKEWVQVTDWSRDGRYISYNTNSGTSGADLWILPTFGDKKPISFLASSFSDADGMFSPDGNWLIYDSNASGKTEIYATPFPGPGGKFQISSAGGDWPRWTNNGKQIVYLVGEEVHVADVTYDKDSLQVVQSRKLFAVSTVGNATSYYHDVTPDGKRFLFVASQQKTGAQRLAWISDWRKQLPK